jgi:hypothetical protein
MAGTISKTPSANVNMVLIRHLHKTQGEEWRISVCSPARCFTLIVVAAELKAIREIVTKERDSFPAASGQRPMRIGRQSLP